MTVIKEVSSLWLRVILWDHFSLYHLLTHLLQFSVYLIDIQLSLFIS